MKALYAIAIAVGLLSGCAVDRHEARAGVKGALIGAAGGAALSALAGGDPAKGAAIGAAAGATVGVVSADSDRHDRRGDHRW
nr:YMGG-like glycine zipper-containing protein [Cupriavidus sp. 2SB]